MQASNRLQMVFTYLETYHIVMFLVYHQILWSKIFNDVADEVGYSQIYFTARLVTVCSHLAYSLGLLNIPTSSIERYSMYKNRKRQ